MTGQNENDRHFFSGNGEVRLGFLEAEDCWVNLSGDYSYLRSGYYASQNLEAEGKAIR